MKLSRKDINEVRKFIIEKLVHVPDGQRIHLDKELLEDLLFETFVLDKENDIKIKLPIWSGKFLQKLDLSEVDFSDVSWGMFNRNKIEFNIYVSNKVTKAIADTRKRVQKAYCNRSYLVDYSNTNAKIDLTKSFDAIRNNCINIHSCDFEGVDFSNQGLKDAYNIETIVLSDSNLSNTKLEIPKSVSLRTYYTSLEGLDLHGRKIDLSNMSDCNLRNTGINIIIDSNAHGYIRKVKESLENGEWVGCYLNGKKVLTKEEKKQKINEIASKYSKMQSDTLMAIDEQFKNQLSSGKIKKKTKNNNS